MEAPAAVTYPPLGALKPIAPEVWIIDGPAIRFGGMPFPTRTTVVRLAGGRLFVHSPTALDDGLAAAVRALGEPAWIVGPNRIHYWWLPDWRAAFPEAGMWLAPGIAGRAKGRIAFPFRDLAAGPPWPWADEIDTLPIASGYMTEVEFFHRPSRTLILTDLIENFEADRLASPLWRLIARAGGVLAPDGAMPRDMRATFLGRRRALRAAVETMIGWAPERVVIAHGAWLERDGAAELRRAFRWLLRRGA